MRHRKHLNQPQGGFKCFLKLAYAGDVKFSQSFSNTKGVNMARMHSRAKGVSGSKKPLKKSVPTWVRYKPTEVESLVTKAGKDGLSPSQIGLLMRDTYGIPDVKNLTGKPILKILKEKGVAPSLPEDLRALIKKAALVRKHLDENKLDYTAKHGLLLTESKIGRLIKYYKGANILPMDWKYDTKKISTYLE
jgi:small subunit ribosomal protein S15